MTREGLDLLIDRVAGWPAEAQDALMKSIEKIEADHDVVYRVNDDERRGIEQGLNDLREGRFAKAEEVEAVFARFK